MSKDNNFDLIRLYAALSVMLVHALTHLGVAGPWADVLNQIPGVPIFFFISGYLILPSFRRSDGIIDFARRRALRIFPALYVCFGLSVILVFAFGGLKLSNLSDTSFWLWVLAQLTVGQFYNLQTLRPFGSGVLNGSLWTISVELQFYVLTPLVAWMADRIRQFFPLAIGALLVPNLVFAAVDNGSLPAKLLMVTATPWFYMFLTGAWLSSRPDLAARLAALPWPAMLVGYAIQAAATAFGLPAGNAITPISFFLLICLVLKCAYSAPYLADRLLRRNDVSYGTYIYHMPIINLVLVLGLAGHVASVLVAAVATLIAAALSWIAVERPALGLKSRRPAPIVEIASAL